MNATSSSMTIDVQALKKTYPGGVEAVRGVDFDVGPAKCSGCWAQTARANRRRSGC